MPTGCAQDESDKKCGKWECFTQCKPLTVFEVDAIVFLRLPLAYIYTAPSAKTVDFPLLHSLANISVMQ